MSEFWDGAGCRDRVELGDTLGGRDPATLEVPLKMTNECTQRYTWRPRSSEFRDTLAGRDRVNPEMHFEAVI